MPSENKPRVITIFGPKGGVGKSFIAANLAAAFRLNTSLKPALIDFDSVHQDAAKLMGGMGIQCIAEPLSAESLPEAVSKLRQSASVILIDAGSVLSDLTVAAFEQSNLILLVTTPDTIAIRHAQETIKQFTAIKLPLRMVGVVINRAESRGNLRSIEVKTQLSTPVVAEIPSDGRLAGLSVNQCIPVVAMEEASRIKEAFKRFVKFLLDDSWIFVERLELDASHLPKLLSAVEGLPGSNGSAGASNGDRIDPLLEMRKKIHGKMIERFDLKRLDLRAIDDPQKAAQLRERMKQVALELIAEEGVLPAMQDRERMVKEIVDEVLGLGPLEDLLADQEISDILVNGRNNIYVEKRGKLSRTDKKFMSDEQVLMIIERIIAPLGRRIDESSPMVDARLSDGSRVNAIIPPLSVAGPMLSIRKFSRQRYTLDDLIRFNTLSADMGAFLNACVQARKNIIVSGATGSGKTTLLNAFSSFIPDDERIITIEDAAELRLSQAHWVPLEARPANIEGRGDVTVRQLFRNTLRMRPDRIIIGECRSDETLDMLQAMNTGHDGSMTTLHANSPSDVISRLDSLVLMSNVDLPVRAIREQIVSAIHLIVHSARMSDGSRKITHITELNGLDDRDGVLMTNLFHFEQQGLSSDKSVLGVFKPTGHLPSFFDELKAKGFALREEMFLPSKA